MRAPDFDLQAHSTRSDGSLEPEAVVAAAARAGVRLLALTDHDTVDGVEEALHAGAEHRIQVVPATEISAVEGIHEDLHVLGYGVDHRDPVLAAWVRRVHEILSQDEEVERCRKRFLTAEELETVRKQAGVDF